MRSIWVKWTGLVLIFGFILSWNLEARGEDWHYYGTKDDIGQFFYDKDSVTFLSGGVVRVWGRTIKDAHLKKAIEENKEAIQKFIEGKLQGKKSVSKDEIEKMYENWQREFLRTLVIPEKRVLVELKCGENMFRLLSGIEYDEKGSAKRGFSASQPEWLRIASESPIEGLYNTLCQKSNGQGARP